MEIVRTLNVDHDFGYRLLKALKMEDKFVTKLVFTLEANKIATIEITEYLHEQNVDIDATENILEEWAEKAE